jgi:hypothetical protein
MGLVFHVLIASHHTLQKLHSQVYGFAFMGQVYVEQQHVHLLYPHLHHLNCCALMHPLQLLVPIELQNKSNHINIIHKFL